MIPDAQSFAVGDLNNDGKDDIATSTGASFAAPVEVPVALTAVFIGDVNHDARNGDGFVDLAVTLHLSTTLEDDQLAVLLNNGQGGFGPPQVYFAVPAHPRLPHVIQSLRGSP
jgi:hypothetical protein